MLLAEKKDCVTRVIGESWKVKLPPLCWLPIWFANWNMKCGFEISRVRDQAPLCPAVQVGVRESMILISALNGERADDKWFIRWFIHKLQLEANVCRDWGIFDWAQIKEWRMHLKYSVLLFIYSAFSARSGKLIEINYFICYCISGMASGRKIVFFSIFLLFVPCWLAIELN